MPVTNGKAIKPIFDRLKSGIGEVAFIGIGDSNQETGGFGWDHGIPHGLSQHYEMLATSARTHNVNGTTGSGGYKHSNTGTSLLSTANVADFENKFPSGQAINYKQFQMANLLTGVSDSNSPSMIIEGDCPIDNGSSLTFYAQIVKFSGGNGSYRNFIRHLNDWTPNWAQIAAGPVVSVAGGASNTLEIDSFALSSDPARSGFLLSWKRSRQNNSDIIAPYAEGLLRARNVDRNKGWSFTSILSAGGWSLYNFLNRFLNLINVDTMHQNVYDFINATTVPSTSPLYCFVINSGMNDRNEGMVSIGPIGGFTGNSADAYKDNLQGLINEIKTQWTLKGNDINFLYFMIIPSHPPSLNSSQIVTYAQKAIEVAKENLNTVTVDIRKITTTEEMTANSWYAIDGTNGAHLSQSGYEQLGIKIINALIDAAFYIPIVGEGGNPKLDNTKNPKFAAFSESSINPNSDSTYINITPTVVSEHLFTDWEIRPETSSKATIKIRTDRNGITNKKQIPSIEQANLTTLGISLNRSEKWLMRFKTNESNWSNWSLLDLSGELRIIGAQHRDKFVTKKTTKGLSVENTNPQFISHKTNRGIRIENKKYSSRSPRAF